MSYLEMGPILSVTSSGITRSESDCVVNVDLPRPPETSGLFGVPSGRSSEETIFVPAPCDVENDPSPRVWLERFRERRQMTSSELELHSELFEAIDAGYRSHVIDIVILTCVYLFLYILFLCLLYTGVIPFCNIG